MMVREVEEVSVKSRESLKKTENSALGKFQMRFRAPHFILLLLLALVFPREGDALVLGSPGGIMAFAPLHPNLQPTLGKSQRWLLSKSSGDRIGSLGVGQVGFGIGRRVKRVQDGSVQMRAAAAAIKVAEKGAEAAALIIPKIALKNALLPIILVIVLCVLAAIPLSPSISTPDPAINPESPDYVKLSKLRQALRLQRRVFTSVSLGAVVTAWIFSGTWAFTLVMCWVGPKALLEYYALAEAANDCRPAKKSGLLALMTMLITACLTAYGLPFAYTDAVLPMTYILILGYFIVFNKQAVKLTIADVQTTFMGIFYIGYLSSFWVRLRALGMIPSSEVYKLMFGTSSETLITMSNFFPVWFRPDIFTQGAIVTWWTMISIASADVGAYFSGKNFGKTKLSEWIGITISPNKTKEGFIGGMLLCTCFATTGARLMQWPLWWLTGPIYGCVISCLGLLGDLTVSLFKRDAGVKDTGSVLPGHGGLLDRIDSYMLTAAPVYFLVKFISQYMK